MKNIELDPHQFSFPNFCFERKYNYYLFLQSAILADNEVAQTYFFEILVSLEENNKSKKTIIKDKWNLLIPKDISWNWADFRGNSGSHKVNKGTKTFTLNNLKNYLLDEFYEQNQSQFINLVPEFWIEFNDQIALYALYNAEIIIIGTDIKPELSKITVQKFPFYFYSSFVAYIDHWGPVFRWNKSQINFLKEQFSSNSSKED